MTNPNIFKHNYQVVTDMFGRARYECSSCIGPEGIGPWHASKDEVFNQDWADQDGSDHAYGLRVHGDRKAVCRKLTAAVAAKKSES
jgi:hypothetical protein